MLQLGQVSLSIDIIGAIWSVLPVSTILIVFFFAFTQKIKGVVDEKVKEYSKKQTEQTEQIIQSNLDSIDKFETRYEQRLIMMDAKLHATELNLTNTREIVKALETHNMHILKSMDEIKESVQRLHIRLDK